MARCCERVTVPSCSETGGSLDRPFGHSVGSADCLGSMEQRLAGHCNAFSLGRSLDTQNDTAHIQLAYPLVK